MDKVRCNIMLDTRQVKLLREREIRTGATVSAQVRIAVDFWLKEQAELERALGQLHQGKKHDR